MSKKYSAGPLGDFDDEDELVNILGEFGVGEDEAREAFAALKAEEEEGDDDAS